MPAKRSPVRVLVVDRQPLVRAGICSWLAGCDDLEVAGEAGGPEQALWAARLHRPGLVVLGEGNDGSVAAEALAALAERAPTLRLADDDDVTAVHRAFAAGARGVVARSAEAPQLIEAIRVVAGGGRYVDPLIGGRLAQAAVDAARAGADDPLTAREHEVLRLVALGYTNHEIGARVGVSIRTVEAHRAHVLEKLGLVARHELVAYALRNGLVSRDDVDVLRGGARPEAGRVTPPGEAAARAGGR